MNADPSLEKPTRKPLPISGHVLCVDDEANILNALRRLLRNEDYAVHYAQSGAEALEILESEPIDVLVTDMRMPGMSGIELLQQTTDRWPAVFRIVLTGYSDLDAAIAAINQGRVYRYLNKPWEDNDLRLTLSHALQEKRLGDERQVLRQKLARRNLELAVMNESLESQVKERTRELQTLNLALVAAHQQVRNSYHHVITTFAHLIRLREGRSDGHSVAVGKLSVAIGVELGLDHDSLQNLYFGAVLHDVGQSVLPERLFMEPESSLSLSERAQARQHCVLGAALFANIEDLKEMARTIRHHHEAFDGSGYPDGLAGEEIPVGARIVAIASEYDRLKSGLREPRRLDPMTAASVIQASAGKQFDPTIVAAFVRALEKKQRETTELCLPCNRLVQGMRLSRDLFGQEGMLLIPAGYEITETVIQMLRTFEQETSIRLKIHVYRP